MLLAVLFYAVLVVRGVKSSNEKTTCNSVSIQKDTVDGWHFFKKGDVLHMNKRAYSYSTQQSEPDDVECSAINVTSKDQDRYQASISVTFYNKSHGYTQTLTDTYVFSMDQDGKKYNKLEAMPEGDIGGAFKFMYADDHCAVLKIDSEALSKTGAQSRSGSEDATEDGGDGAKGEQNEEQKPYACFILRKSEAKQQSLACCLGAVKTERHYMSDLPINEESGNCKRGKDPEERAFRIRYQS